jgi:hypothetical protein
MASPSFEEEGPADDRVVSEPSILVEKDQDRGIPRLLQTDVRRSINVTGIREKTDGKKRSQDH